MLATWLCCIGEARAGTVKALFGRSFFFMDIEDDSCCGSFYIAAMSNASDMLSRLWMTKIHRIVQCTQKLQLTISRCHECKMATGRRWADPGKSMYGTALSISSLGRAFLRYAWQALRKARGMPSRQLQKRPASPVIVFHYIYVTIEGSLASDRSSGPD